MSDPVSLLDYSDLRCCDKQMTLASRWWASVAGRATHRVKGFACETCKHFVTEMAFLQNSHGTRSQRRARIAEMRG